MADEKLDNLQGKNGKLTINADKLLNIKDGDLKRILDEEKVSLKSCEENLEKIREWYEKQPHLPKGQIDDQMLIRYLVSCNFSTEKVKDKLDNFYSAKNKMSDLLKNRDPLSPTIENVLKTGYWLLLPKRTDDNHRISIFRLPENANKDTSFADIVKISFMIGEYRLWNDVTGGEHWVFDYQNVTFQFAMQCTPTLVSNITFILSISFMIGEYRLWNDVTGGEHWVFDYQNVTFQFAMQCTPTLVSNITFILSHCLAAKLKGVHLIGIPQYCEALLNLFKRAMKPKVAERINIYNSYEELYKKLPKALFPSDFGGNEISSKEITGEYYVSADKQLLQKLYNYNFTKQSVYNIKCSRKNSWLKTFQTPEWRQYFLDQDEACSDESKREGVTKLDEVFGVEGSFRKLDID
ncbi:alpha-tocopherol transfer protein-like [Plutella xylostella]|uniref:alpha-tocopherol transfer protein-like n=1 Tax=Plutella xylostella TaxID=51655 RepID=UPI002032B4C7|nr:alpha-tocopherol transfer protein-like [Plutella xylostella]